MEDPVKEIRQVVQLLTAAVNPEIQKDVVLRYYTPDVSFRHPFCAVPPSTAPPSRDAVLGIYQWYRVMSPRMKSTVHHVTYDPADPTHLFLEVEQVFHIRWSPFAPAPSHLTVHLTLRPASEGDKTRYYIASQEDFYHPEDLAALLVPPLIPLVRFGLRLAALQSNIGKRIAGMFGYWTVRPGEGGRDIPLQPEGEPPPVSPRPASPGPVAAPTESEKGASSTANGDVEPEADAGEQVQSDKKND